MLSRWDQRINLWDSLLCKIVLGFLELVLLCSRNQFEQYMGHDGPTNQQRLASRKQFLTDLRQVPNI